MVSASMYSLFLNWPWISGLSNHIPLQKNIAQPEMRGMVSAYMYSFFLNWPWISGFIKSYTTAKKYRTEILKLWSKRLALSYNWIFKKWIRKYDSKIEFWYHEIQYRDPYHTHFKQQSKNWPHNGCFGTLLLLWAWSHSDHSSMMHKMVKMMHDLTENGKILDKLW